MNVFLFRSLFARLIVYWTGKEVLPIFRQHYLLSALGALTTALLLVSCSTTKMYEPSTVTYRDEAGGVLLSVNSVGRWEQVADAMQPKFSLTNGDAALSKVIPTTARLQQQVLDAFGVSLGLGLPQSFSGTVATRTITDNKTSSVNNGTTTNEEKTGNQYDKTTTDTTQAGIVPTTPGGIPAGGEFPSGMTPGSDLGQNPILQYRAAASLYQAVQLMNREVELAAKRKGFVPYLVRIQLVNIPYRRHLPYDIHAQIAFFPSHITLPLREVDDNTMLPYVVPLIVTDDLEQAIKSRAAEVARQIGLAVSMMVQGVGGKFDSNWEKRNRESLLAADINSLLTVSRLSDNTIYIRLGATNEATGGYSMVGRTYDIALLLLVPDAYFANSGQIHGSPGGDAVKSVRASKEKNPVTPKSQPVTLSIITHTDLRNASSGSLLKETRDVIPHDQVYTDAFDPGQNTAYVSNALERKQDSSFADQVDNAFKQTLNIVHPKMFNAWSQKTPEDKMAIAKKLISAINTSDYKRYYDETKSIILKSNTKEDRDQVSDPEKDRCLKAESNDDPKTRCLCQSKSDKFKEDRLACIDGGYLRKLWVYLASTTVENATKSASVELPYLPDIVIPEQTALMRDDGKEKLDILLRNVSGITPGVITAKLVLANDGVKPYEFPAETITADPLTGILALQFPSPAKWNLGTIDYGKSRLLVEPRPCIYQFESACAKVIQSKDGSYSVLHALVSTEKPKPGFDMRASMNEIVVNHGEGTVKLVFDNFVTADKAVLTWSGAEVKSAKNSNGKKVTIELDKIIVDSATVLTLEIQNAKADGKVTFKAAGSKGKKPTNEVIKEFNIVASK